MRATAVLLAALLVLATCSSDTEGTADSPDSASPDSDEPERVEATPTPELPADEDAAESDSDQSPADVALVRNQLLQFQPASGFAVRPGHESLFVAQLDGAVYEVEFGDDGRVGETPRVVLDLTQRAKQGAEQGLLGIAFSPDGERLYAVYSNTDGDNELVSWALDSTGIADPDTELAHLLVPQPDERHNGGQIVFGPDGYLYYSLGDGVPGADPLGSGQDLSTLLGAVLRIDPDPIAGDYVTPDDNPFVGTPDAAPEIWLYGVRNPWRFSFDAETGDLWVADVGELRAEELNLLPATEGGGAGANLGWNAFEGSMRFSEAEAPNHQPPTFEYDHEDGGCAVVGGFVYRGNAIPELQGSYVYSDYCDGVVRAFVPGFGSRPLSGGSSGAFSLGEGPDHELYIADADGVVSRLEASGQNS